MSHVTHGSMPFAAGFDESISKTIHVLKMFYTKVLDLCSCLKTNKIKHNWSALLMLFVKQICSSKSYRFARG